VRPPPRSTRHAAAQLLRCSLDAGSRVAVIYLGADGLAHYREGRVVAIQGSRFVLAYLDPARTARRASFDLANRDDVLTVRPVR
jgi:hypothetical protein